MNDVEEIISNHSEIVFYFDNNMPDRQKGLYIDNAIYLNAKQTLTEMKGTVAEEIGHHLTSVGEIIDLGITENMKQELKARSVGYEIALPLESLIDCRLLGLTEVWQCAEFTNVEPDYFFDALENYQQVYGNRFMHEGYLFDFHYGNGLTITEIST